MRYSLDSPITGHWIKLWSEVVYLETGERITTYEAAKAFLGTNFDEEYYEKGELSK